MTRIFRVTLACLSLGVVAAGCGGSSRAPVAAVPPPPVISSDASLAELSVSAAGFDQVFQPTLYDYTGTASYLGRSTTITATANDAGASIEINGAAAHSGEASDPVALDMGANLVTVTVTAEDGVTMRSYSVTIDREDPAKLAQQTYIKASNTGDGDQFGGAVALSGDTLAIVANQEDSAATGINGDSFDDSAAGAGAVYVFRRDETNTWIEEAYIKASNTGTGDAFGRSIALSGDTLAVGAFHEDSAATGIDGDQTDNGTIDAGAVYVFTRDATGSWVQQPYIKASNTDSTDGFGVSVALAGDTLAVGAHLEDSTATGIDGDQSDNSSANSGAVYVFARDAAGLWTQQAYIKASNTDSDDQFGKSVSLSDDTLAVGAPNERSKTTGINGDQTNNSWSGTGAVYVFTRDATDTWNQQAYIKASNTGNGDLFGESIALSGDTLVAGAPLEDSAATGVDGFQGDNKALSSGAAYVFTRDAAGDWTQQAYVKASNTDIQDQFGRALALDDGFLAVGAIEDSVATGVNGDQADNSSENSGAVYLFERDAAGTWTQIAYAKASNTGTLDGFGSAMAIGGTSLVISSDLEDSSATGVDGDQSNNDSPDSGAVYIIE
jgi:hypothetical protein